MCITKIFTRFFSAAEDVKAPLFVCMYFIGIPVAKLLKAQNHHVYKHAYRSKLTVYSIKERHSSFSSVI